MQYSSRPSPPARLSFRFAATEIVLSVKSRSVVRRPTSASHWPPAGAALKRITIWWPSISAPLPLPRSVPPLPTTAHVWFHGSGGRVPLRAPCCSRST
eukprot:5818849-Prymnesium_polylepis.1